MKSKYPNYYKMSRKQALDAYWDIEIALDLLAAKFSEGSKKKLIENFKGDLFLGKRISYLLWERVEVLQRLNNHEDTPKEEKSNVVSFSRKVGK